MAARPGPFPGRPQEPNASQGPAERPEKATARRGGLRRGPRPAGGVRPGILGGKNGLDGCSCKSGEQRVVNGEKKEANGQSPGRGDNCVVQAASWKE